MQACCRMRQGIRGSGTDEDIGNLLRHGERAQKASIRGFDASGRRGVSDSLPDCGGFWGGVESSDELLSL